MKKIFEPKRNEVLEAVQPQIDKFFLAKKIEAVLASVFLVVVLFWVLFW